MGSVKTSVEECIMLQRIKTTKIVIASESNLFNIAMYTIKLYTKQQK